MKQLEDKQAELELNMEEPEPHNISYILDYKSRNFGQFLISI